jgi:predicted ATP-dependent serine protease
MFLHHFKLASCSVFPCAYQSFQEIHRFAEPEKKRKKSKQKCQNEPDFEECQNKTNQSQSHRFHSEFKTLQRIAIGEMISHTLFHPDVCSKCYLCDGISLLAS